MGTLCNRTTAQKAPTKMFVKLAVFACVVAVSLAAWHGPLAGGTPADKYPAGVSPQACPNYPHCDNPAVAANPSAPSHGGWNGGWNGGAAAGAGAWNGGHGGWNGGNAGGWNGGAGAAGGWNGGAAAGGWDGGHGAWNGGNNGGGWNGGSWNQNSLDAGEYTGDGDYRGEGLAESGAYGDVSQNYHSGNGGGAAAYAPVAHGHGAAQVPAGVDPHSCPNYPFCH